MIGIFDSGIGGLTSLKRLRELRPEADVFYLADKARAPYGEKSEDEVLEICAQNIENLRRLGAEKILIACCTASTVYDRLSFNDRQICIPIIDAGAMLAIRASATKRIGVLSTQLTMSSGAFPKAIGRICKQASCVCAHSGELVHLAESGYCDANMSADAMATLESALLPFVGSDIDTLILGCTHFTYFEKSVRKILNVCTVCPSYAGAEIAASYVSGGSGRTVYIE